MKKIYAAGLATILFFAACENSGSSTVGSYDDEDAAPVSGKNANNLNDQSANNGNNNTNSVSIDTAKNITGISRDSMSSKNKKDSGTSVYKKNVKAQKTKKIETQP